MNNFKIPYGKQNITEKDIDAVITALKADFLTQGPKIAEFEEAFAKYIGCKYAVAVANGTAALHLCAMAADVNQQTNVITSPITFSASANCIKYCGGNVFFADIEKDTYLVDSNKVEDLLRSKPAGFFSGIIPVDFAGRPVNLEDVKVLADKYKLWIIEDACHAPGGYFVNSSGSHEFCGNGRYADMAIFSFHPVKHIACGEGGMITTNSEVMYKKLLKYRTHGITKESGTFLLDASWAAGQASDEYPNWYMEMQELGYNYRLTDFQAALGITQLERADWGLERRKQIAAVYQNAFKDASWLSGQSGVVEGHAYHLYIVEVENRLFLYKYLAKNNIFSQVHYIPVHLMPYYRNFGWKEGDFPIAEHYYSKCLSLPMYPTLTDEEQQYVISTINNFYDKK